MCVVETKLFQAKKTENKVTNVVIVGGSHAKKLK